MTIRIVTDTASDITVDEAKAMNIDLIALTTAFEDGTFPLNSEADYVTRNK